jgi:hypothetical protein
MKTDSRQTKNLSISKEKNKIKKKKKETQKQSFFFYHSVAGQCSRRDLEMMTRAGEKEVEGLVACAVKTRRLVTFSP